MLVAYLELEHTHTHTRARLHSERKQRVEVVERRLRTKRKNGVSSEDATIHSIPYDGDKKV